MDRLNRESTSGIINKGPIVLDTEAPRGYVGIRTTIQIRNFHVATVVESGGDELSMDIAINTEVRRGQRAWGQLEIQEEVVKDHRDVSYRLLEIVKALVRPGLDVVESEQVPHE
jgi:hypothetical protein